MKRYIVDFEWPSGRKDWRGVDANNEQEAEKIFRQGGSFWGSYEQVKILKIQER